MLQTAAKPEQIEKVFFPRPKHWKWGWEVEIVICMEKSQWEIHWDGTVHIMLHRVASWGAIWQNNKLVSLAISSLAHRSLRHYSFLFLSLLQVKQNLGNAQSKFKQTFQCFNEFFFFLLELCWGTDKKNTCLDQNLRRGRQFFSMFNFGQVWPTSQRAKHSIFFLKKTLICIVYGCYHQNSSFYRKEKPYSLPVNLLVQLTTAGCISWWIECRALKMSIDLLICFFFAAGTHQSTVRMVALPCAIYIFHSQSLELYSCLVHTSFPPNWPNQQCNSMCVCSEISQKLKSYAYLLKEAPFELCQSYLQVSMLMQ